MKPTTAAPSGAGLDPGPDRQSAGFAGNAEHSAPGPVARVLFVALRGYKILISPLFAGSCRFTPSCADYMAEAIRVHGALAGLGLGVRRLARCHPWGPWGVDPVPGSQPPRRAGVRSGAKVH